MKTTDIKQKIEQLIKENEFQTLEELQASNEKISIKQAKELFKKVNLREYILNNQGLKKGFIKELFVTREYDEKISNLINTPEEILEELSKSDIKEVRRNVANNTSTPKEVLEKLSKDKDRNIINKVLNNSNTPEEVFYSLFETSNNSIKYIILTSSYCPYYLLINDIEEVEEKSILSKRYIDEYLAKNHNILEDEFFDLNLNDYDVVKGLIYNPNTPEEVLNQFVNNRLDSSLLYDLVHYGVHHNYLKKLILNNEASTELKNFISSYKNIDQEIVNYLIKDQYNDIVLSNLILNMNVKMKDKIRIYKKMLKRQQKERIFFKI